MTRKAHHFSLLLLLAPTACQAPEPTPDRSREGYVTTTDDVRLFYQITGTGPDTLVVLHGGPGLSSAYLAPDLDELGQTFTLIHYDQRGGGRSTVVVDSTRLRMDDHVEDVDAVRVHFGLDQVALLGHSWGAAPAAFYARMYPDRTSRIILVDAIPASAAPHMEHFGQNLRAWMDDSTRAHVELLFAARRDTAKEPVSTCRAYWSVFIRGYYADPADVAMMKGDVCNDPPAALRNQALVWVSVLGAIDWDWRESFHEVDVPVLIIHGAKSPMPLASAYEWERAFPNTELVMIEGAGHFPHVDQPAAFVQAIETFVE